MNGNGFPFAAVVFDFDGTLAELVIDFAEMQRRVARTAAAYLSVVPGAKGAPVLEYAATLARAMDAAATSQRFLGEVADLIQAMEVEAASRAHLFPETKPSLLALAEARIPCGIITRNCRAAVDRVFPDAAEFVGVVLTRDEARHVKPDPRHLLDALTVLDADPARSLMVGDHPMDLATGKAAGALTAGVASGRVGLEDLGRAGADYLARNVGELLPLVLGRNEEKTKRPPAAGRD